MALGRRKVVRVGAYGGYMIVETDQPTDASQCATPCGAMCELDGIVLCLG
jgi:hypothetical protein